MRKKNPFPIIICILPIIMASLGTNFFFFKIGSRTIGNERIGFILTVIIDILYSVSHHRFSIRINRGDYKYIQFMIIWLLYGVVNVFFVREFEEYIENVEMLTQGVVYCLIFHKNFNDYHDIISCLKSFCYVGVLHNIIGWYEFITGNYLFVVEERAWMFRRWSNPVSSFGNCNDFAIYLFLVFVISIYLFFCNRNGKSKASSYFYLLLSLSTVSIIILTGSRACMIASVLAVVAGVLLFLKESKKKKQLNIFLVACIIAIPVLMYLINRFSLISQINNSFNARGADVSNAHRITIYKNGLNFLLDSYGIGIGAGSADYWLRNLSHYPVAVHKLHSWFLEILACYGIFIFIYYIVIYIQLVKRGLSNIKNNALKRNNVYYVESIFIVYLCGYIFASMSAGSLFKYSWVWLMWALIIVSKGIHISSQAKPTTIAQK